MSSAPEKLDRGLIAARRQDGAVHLGWRGFAGEEDVEFGIYRRGSMDKDFQHIDCVQGTSYLDESVSGRIDLYQYRVKPEANDAGEGFTDSYLAIEKEKNLAYMSIPLQGDYTPGKVALADLDGDGELEIIIKQPNFSTDPYQAAGYWKRSRETYKLEAYKLDGTLMWRYDMGWAIEEGIWYSPFLAYDIDQDGKAEVYAKAGVGDPRERTGHVTSGPEYLVALDGETGEIRRKIPWPSREGFAKYNYYSRNFLGVAYLDGQNPYLIISRGTYGLIKMQALDRDLDEYWSWESTGEDREYAGQGSHGMHAADIDGDGCDEIVYGSAVIDHDGKPLWNLRRGHPDILYVTDIDPGREGMEIFYGFEQWAQKGAVCLVDAASGEVIWENEKPTKHVHGQGMVANIDPDHSGKECYAGEQDGSKYWLYTAQGKLLSRESLGTLVPTPVYWDDDQFQELIINNELGKYRGESYGKIEGRILAVVDCLGDWREEVITALEGEIRIYTTPFENRKDSRPTLLHNRQYRAEVAMRSMGYYYPPQLGPDWF